MFKIIVIISLFFVSCSAKAHVPSLDECLEASQFISHASMSRDNGYPWEKFAEQMQNDIQYLEMIEPKYRWFIQDISDAIYLYEWAEVAFNNKKTPDENATDFLNSCVTRMNSIP